MVKIITDTTSCLSPEFAKKYDIPVIPQIINFGEESFYEGIQIDIPTFMKRLRASAELPKTAAPPPELFIQEFNRLAPLGEPIICIHPSTEVSGTVRSAVVAAREFPNLDIRVIDTRLVASPVGTMVELAAAWASAGETVDMIAQKIEEMCKRCRLYFVVATLEYLQRGGRIGGAAALIGSMLQIKPILCMRDGRVDQYERERTHRRAVQRLKELVDQQAPHNGGAYLTVLHAGVLQEGQALANDLSQIINQPTVPVVDMPPAIVTHGGPGILGVGFFTQE